jgi:hypothetical protein
MILHFQVNDILVKKIFKKRKQAITERKIFKVGPFNLLQIFFIFVTLRTTFNKQTFSTRDDISELISRQSENQNIKFVTLICYKHL